MTPAINVIIPKTITATRSVSKHEEEEDCNKCNDD